MTVAYENQFDLKHYTKADSNDIELALIGIEIMEEIQQMARQNACGSTPQLGMLFSFIPQKI